LRKSQALVLVLSNQPDSLFTSPVRQTAGGIWIRAEHPHQLADYMTALAALRDGRSADAIMLAVMPAAYRHKEALLSQLDIWQQAIHRAGKTAGLVPAVVLSVYAPLGSSAAGDDRWYGWASAKRGEKAVRFTDQALQPVSEVRLAIDGCSLAQNEVQPGVMAQALMDWAAEQVIPFIQAKRAGARPLQINALCLHDQMRSGAAENIWGQYLLRRTGLALPVNLPVAARLSALPDLVLPVLPVQRRAGGLWRGAGHLSLIIALFLSLTFISSVWHNKQLLNQIDQHLQRYYPLQITQDTARKKAIRVLEKDRQQLQDYARAGVPLRLGMGFYRGYLALPALDRAIASYAPPPPLPATIELDSMSLFDSGKSVLKPGSNRYLLKAAGLISQHAGQRILVAGHTDSTGNPKINERLSLARAEAVREGLMDALSLPSSQFAVQGYGESRPVESNETTAGRARNRRVEITLVPAVPAR
ncbi:MAG: OmpA family protein, partial [Iodobacter sp.]